LAAIREGQKAAYDRRIIGTEFTQRADFATMARAFGAEGIRASESYSDLRDAVQHGLNCGKPCVIDVIIEQDAVPPPVAGNWCEPERDWPEPIPRAGR
jgi:acetolactate synthase-1/2/3 large subunit